MSIRTRVLALLLVLYGITISPVVAATDAHDMVFTYEETARLDSLRDLMAHYQEKGDYAQAFAVGQAYNHFRIQLQEKALNYQNHSRLVLLLCLFCSILTVAALCLLYLHAFHNHKRRMEKERLKAEDILLRTQADDATQNRFLAHLDKNIRKPADEIILHSLRIYGKQATTDPIERAISHRLLHARSKELLDLMETLMDDCKGRARRSKDSLLRLVILAVCLTGLSVPSAHAVDMHARVHPAHDTLGMPNRDEYCYREDGIEPYELAGYHVDLMRHEEVSMAYRRNLLFVMGCLLVAFVFYLVMRVQDNRRYAREWQVRMAETERATLLAAEARARKAHFLERVSHELRTPLNAILGFSDILCDAEMCAHMPADEQEECRRRGRHGTHDLQLMVNGALEICALGTGQQPVTLSACHLPTLLEEVRRAYLAEADEGVELRVTVEGEPLTGATHDDFAELTTRSDYALLKRAVSLLMDNACKFTREGSITLSASTTADGGMEIAVTDTGCGVPADKAEVIFRHFVKLDEFVTGIGLGLSLCRATLHLLGSTVHLDTEYQGGSRFVIRIPS